MIKTQSKQGVRMDMYVPPILDFLSSYDPYLAQAMLIYKTTKFISDYAQSYMQVYMIIFLQVIMLAVL